MKSSTATMLVVLLVGVLLALPSTAAFPRRVLLDQHEKCETECTDTFEDNVKRCIAETKLGEPPEITEPAAGFVAKAAYVPPEDTGFELVEEKCRELQQPELDKCKTECNKAPPKEDCAAVSKKCDETFDKGTMLAAWCRQKKDC